MLRLSDLDPRWVGTGGEGITRNGHPVPYRARIGVSFECPCGGGCPRAFIPFENPPDGGPSTHKVAWHRAGDDFETLTLAPSIQRNPSGRGRECRWHGWVRNGEVISC